MQRVSALASEISFRREARAFAKWYATERKAAYELGRIAARWLESYSRTNNARIFAAALHSVTGLRVSGRTITYYKDVYLLDKAWREDSRRDRAKSRNDFKIRHVGPGHLRVVSQAKLSDARKLDLLDAVERQRLNVKRTTALVCEMEIAAKRNQRTARPRRNDPRVMKGDAIAVVQRMDPGSIHHCFCDWQWENNGIWRDIERRHPVHRPEDPADHLCRFLRVARPYLNQQAIVWIFSKTTAFENGEIGLPRQVQETAFDLGLQYASEYVVAHTVSGYKSKQTFLAVKHQPLHPFVPIGFDFDPVKFAPSLSVPITSPNHISQLKVAEERHPYQKPAQLFEELISMGTPKGFVFDAFSGSGAAGVAAISSGCPYLGAELQTHYVRMANRAIANAIGEQTKNASTA